ncbi:MAG: alpha/beta fold hydrolase [Burkholderiaceae bacterium]
MTQQVNWQLDQTIPTSAGLVRAGCAGTGPDLILAHGWPWSSYSWHRIIPTLAERFRVYWYDMPGYGQSEKNPDTATSLDAQGRVFEEILVHWGLNRPNVIAHDFGGATTLRAHLLHGCNYDRYLMMNVVAMRPWGSDFFAHVGRHIDAFSGLPPHIHKAIVNAYIQGALVNDLVPEDFDALTAPWLTETGATSFYRQFAQADEAFTAEIEPDFKNIRCPVRILWGEQDPWIPLARGRALQACIAQASFTTLPGVGHLPQLEAPNAVLTEALPFLTGA